MIARYRRQQYAIVGNIRDNARPRRAAVPYSLHVDALLNMRLFSIAFGASWSLYLHMYPIYAAYARNSRDPFQQPLPEHLRTQPNWWENAK